MSVFFSGASGISTTGNITGSYFFGDGSNLTGVPGANGATGPQGPT